MNHNLRSLARGGLRSILLIGLLCVLAGSIRGEAGSTLLDELTTLAETTELALYLAKASVLAVDEADARLHLQALVDMLDEHPGSTAPRSGLLPSALIARDAVFRSTFPSILQVDFENAISSVVHFVTLAGEAAVAGVETEGAPLPAYAHRAYAYLLAALGADESGFGLPGIRQMIDWLPNSVIHISPEQSIQEAVDQLLPGGTLYLSAGTYALSSRVSIDKSLILAKDPNTEGDVLLQGLDDDEPILYLLRNQDAGIIHIEISDLTLRGGQYGISLFASFNQRNVVLTLVNCRVENARESGIISFGGDLTIDHCEIRGNREFGVLSPTPATLRISRTHIADNGVLEIAALPYRNLAGVFATSRSILTIEESTIENNAGAGIHVEEDADLILKNSTIAANQQDGLLVWDHAVVHLQENQFHYNGGMGVRFHSPACQELGGPDSMHHFEGTVSGWGNHISDPSDSSGNGSGAICPEQTYAFLIGKRP